MLASRLLYTLIGDGETPSSCLIRAHDVNRDKISGNVRVSVKIEMSTELTTSYAGTANLISFGLARGQALYSWRKLYLRKVMSYNE